jgi:hypothetical protein
MNEFKEMLVTSINLHGLEVGDMNSKACIDHTLTMGSCRGCVNEPGCAVYATVINNMYVRKLKGLDIGTKDWDDEIAKQVAIAKAGIIPTIDRLDT